MNAPQALQKLSPGSCYHIYNRGNNKENIFRTPDNYAYFLSLWKTHIHPVAETFCYNLLPNHFHFFIRVRDSQTFQDFSRETCPKPIEQSFSNLFNAYAKAINKSCNRTGSLFQERYRRREVNDNSYFTSIIGYILTNASKHGFCNHTNNYPHSAYSSLLSTAPTLLLRDEVLDWFGGKVQFIKYIDEYVQGIELGQWLLENENDDHDR